jgi:predicted metalloendopeptidase
MGVIKKVKDKKTLGAAVTELHRYHVFPLFDIAPEQDFKDATKVIAYIDQAGLGLPDRDYYLKDDEPTKRLREGYAGYVEKLLVLGGMKAADAKAAVKDILAIETALAKVSKTRVERRDPVGMYNRLDRAGVAKAAPSFPWDDYFKGLGAPDLKDISVTAPAFLEGMNKLIDETKPAAWKSYLTFHVLNAYANQLPKSFVEARFAFISTLTGQKELQPRWRRCVASTDAALGELVGQAFVKSKFGADAKKAAEEMAIGVAGAFGENLETLDWMDAQTKAKAREKLTKMVYQIGYPAKWRSYDFAIDRKSYGANVLASNAAETKRDLAKIGKPVDKEEWQMSPPTVNAYYNPLLNKMVFPAGILQPPFYSTKFATPVNLGAIGMVVGHELTHGFDDEGAQFDADGNLADWWSPETKAKFRAKTKCVVDQYSKYDAIPGVKLNGELTTGENIADIGGVKMAFRAYRQMRRAAKEAFVADGFSEDQQFFLGFAQAWCAKEREEFSRLRVATDPHSPSKWRVNGALADNPEFAEAFGCKTGSAMRPATACVVW